jgi:alpha-beta hydrolase superfamily lysophospholipase
LTADPATFKRHMAKPEDEEELEWQIVVLRANEAAARILWPLSDTGLAKRMRRIVAPTLIVAGGADRILPQSTAQKFARGVGGKCLIKVVPGAGHLVDLDAPDALAKLVLAHCGAPAAPKAKSAAKTKPASKAKPGAKAKVKAPRAKPVAKARPLARKRAPGKKPR